MSTESEKKGIEASFKSMDTEEFLDIYFNRPDMHGRYCLKN